MTDPDTLAEAIQRAFPDLKNIAPLKIIGNGFSSLAVETANSLIFRIARNAEAGTHYHTEMTHLLRLQAHLPVAIPQPQWYLASSADFPYGIMGYPKLHGIPPEPEDFKSSEQLGSLAQQITRFMVALHQLSPDLLDVQHNPKVQHTVWITQRDTVLPALRDVFSVDDYQIVVRWWELFLADESLRMYPPKTIHGDFWYGNWLVKDNRLTGILDFENLAVGDAAQDFVPLHYMGNEFFNAVLAHYQQADGEVDKTLLNRCASLAIQREFGGLEYAIRYNDAEEFADSIAKIRGTALFRSPPP